MSGQGQKGVPSSGGGDYDDGVYAAGASGQYMQSIPADDVDVDDGVDNREAVRR